MLGVSARTGSNDNTVRYKRQELQTPAHRHRCHKFQAAA